MYGAMDGTSWFGPRTFGLQDNPDWLSLDGDQLTITSNSMFDYTETVSATLLAIANCVPEVSGSQAITVSLTCPDGWTCNDGSTPRVPDPSSVADVEPEELTCLEGTILDNPEEDEWYVEK